MTNETKFILSIVPAIAALGVLLNQPFGFAPVIEGGVSVLSGCVLGVGAGVAVRACVDERLRLNKAKQGSCP